MDRKNLLLIEDHDSLRKLLGRFLSRHYNTAAASDGMEAFKWLTNGNVPDLIILDMSMPGISGLEFLSQIRCSGFYRNLPVIVISGEDNPDTVDQCKSLGIVTYLLKPFNPLELNEIISNTLCLKTVNVTDKC